MFWRVLINDVNLFKSTSRNVRSSVILMRMCTMFSLVRLNVFASSSRSILVFRRKRKLASTFRVVSRLKSISTRKRRSLSIRSRRWRWRTRRKESRREKKKKREKKVKTTNSMMMTRRTTSTFESCRSLLINNFKFRFLSSSTSDRLLVFSSKSKNWLHFLFFRCLVKINVKKFHEKKSEKNASKNSHLIVDVYWRIYRSLLKTCSRIF